MSFLCLSVTLLCHVSFVLSQNGDTAATPTAKKSIFATSDSNRVNSFVKYAFEPLFNSGEIEDLYYGDYTCGSPSKFRFDCGFEIHSPYTPYHESGGFEVEYLESQYGEKWLNLMSPQGESEGWYYDAILDNSMTFWVRDLAKYDGYNDDYVHRLNLQWEWDDKTYYSMFIHNGKDPNDLNQYELISDTFSSKTDDELSLLNKIEPRAVINFNTGNDDDGSDDNDDDSDSEEAVDYSTYCDINGYNIVPVSIGRAVTNVQQNIDWYITLFSRTITDVSNQVKQGITIDANGNTVEYGHIILDTSDGFTVSFYSRTGNKASYGELSIEDMENKINEAHGEVMVNPFCCVDKWYDMHYAIPLSTDEESLAVLESVMQSGEVYLVYYNQIVKLLTETTEDFDFNLDFKGDEHYELYDKDNGIDFNERDTNINDKDNHMRPDGNEDPTDEVQAGVFWTLVEPNGQMVQVPGVTITKIDGTTESGSMIKMFVEPTYWDGDWCPMENTDEYNSYSFGDDIATIRIVTTEDELQHKMNIQKEKDAAKSKEQEAEEKAEKLSTQEEEENQETKEEKEEEINNIRLNFNKNIHGFVEHEYGTEIDSKNIGYHLINLMLLFLGMVIVMFGCYNYNKAKVEARVRARINLSQKSLEMSNSLSNNCNDKIEYTYKTFQ